MAAREAREYRREPEHPAHRRGQSGVGASAVLAVITTVVVILPVVVVTWRTVGRLRSDRSGIAGDLGSAFSLEALVTTGVYALIIGVLATIFALPAAWLIGRAGEGTRRARLLAITLTPLLLPSYLPYAGWGLLRGPNTALGDMLARQEPAVSIFVGKAIAVVGMALWVWPLAALVVAGAVQRSGVGTNELARLDARSVWTRIWLVAWVMRGGLAMAVGLVALVMVGSAVPLHVAQVPTYALNLWKVMQLSPDQTGVWLASVPLLALAAVAGGVIASRLPRLLDRRADGELSAPAGSRRGRLAAIGMALAWGAAVLAPTGLFLWSLQDWRSLGMFWRISGAGVAQSVRLAGCTAAVVMALVLLTWRVVDAGGRRGRALAVWIGAVFLFAGLSPGVLVGAATGSAWSSTPVERLAGGGVLVVLCHVARFGFLGVLGGWWLASLEDREQQWLRWVDGAGSLRGWIAGAVRVRAGVVVGIGVCAGALSLHEIESTVFVLAPGLANLPQQLLDCLHYARDEQLSAAAVNLMGVGSLLAITGSWLVARTCNGSGRNR